MYVIPTTSEMENICADLKYYARTEKIDAIVAIARFLNRIGSRDLVPVIRDFLFDHSCFSYQDGELIPEHKNIVRNINNNFR